jgi:ubiquitin C-terminal hydrolase
VRCADCHYDSVTFKPFSCLSVAYESTLKSSLKDFFKESKFDSQNKYKCEKCHEKTKAKHWIELCYLPEVVIFHVKRFAVIGKKISKHQDFPLDLNMANYQD